MVGVLKDLSPGAVARAIEWNLFGLYATFDRIPGARVDHEPHLMRVCTGLPHELLNGIFRAQFPTEDIDTLPETTPTADELTVEAVRDEPTLMAWLAPLAFGYEFPEPAALALFDLFLGFGFDSDAPFQHYLGRWKGHPIATCSMFFGGGVAGMHTTVVPAYRGQGIGAAMILASMLDARDAGYRVGVANMAPNGSQVQGRLGFKSYCHLGLYMPTQWGGLSATRGGV